MSFRSSAVSKTPRVVVGLLVAAFAVAIIAGGFASADTPGTTLTVTPSSGLTNNQTVTLTGSGYTPGASGTVSECGTNAVNGVGCATIGTLFTDPTGNIPAGTTVNVQSSFTATSGPANATTIDCATDACFIDVSAFTTNATQAISFAPVPVLNPAVTVTPNANLSASQNVNVSGTGFPAGATTNFFECKTVSGVVVSCAPIGSGAFTDGTGAFGPVAVPVTSTFTPTQGDLTPVDCHVDTCVVDASAAGSDAFAPIHFASTQGPGVLTVTPNSGLNPSHQVTVSGTNFSDQASVSIFECKPNTPVQSCVLIGTAFTDNNGNFSTTATVTQTFTATQGTTGPVDCLPANDCNVAASDPGGREGVAGITFAVNIPTTTTTTIQSTTTTTAPESRICATLRAARARYNTSLDRVIAVAPRFIRPILEAGRAAGNAGYDLSLRLAGCAPVNASPARATSAAAVAPAPAPSASAAPATYTVKAGDSLSKIAKQLLGNANAYPVLAQLNGIANPSVIHPGQVLQLPT